MGLSALTVWEVRTAGADVNGGGYRSDAGNTDYSIFDTPEVAVTDAVTNGTTTITSTNATFESAMIGNLLYITGGTGSITGAWYEVITRVSASIITVDRSTGLTTGTGATLNLGGALGSPGGLSLILLASGVAGMNAWVKSGTYTLTTATLNVSNGAPDFGASMSNKLFVLRGYQTTRGDNLANAVIAADTFAPTQMLKLGGNSSGGHICDYITVDGNSQNVNGFASTSATYNQYTNCLALDCDGTSGFDTAKCVRCKASSCAAVGFNGCNIQGCWADVCVTGISGLNLTTISSIASNCTARGFEVYGAIVANCVSYNCGSDGLSHANVNRLIVVVNHISYGNTGSGYNQTQNAQLLNCASGDNSGGRFNVGGDPVIDDGAIALTADPFTSAAGGDFSLNTTAGGGALLRAAGINPYGQTGFLDVGAVQHADPAGGASSILGGGQLTGGFS